MNLKLTNDLAKNDAPGGGGMIGLISDPGGGPWPEGMKGLARLRGWLARNRLSSSLLSHSLWGEVSGSIVVGPDCKRVKQIRLG
jgi:hypothetical protein